MEPLVPGSLLKEAARESGELATNLAESFPMFGTTLLAEDDAESKYFLANPSCVPAAVHLDKALHSLCFEQRQAAKNLAFPIPFP